MAVARATERDAEAEAVAAAAELHRVGAFLLRRADLRVEPVAAPEAAEHPRPAASEDVVVASAGP